MLVEKISRLRFLLFVLRLRDSQDLDKKSMGHSRIFFLRHYRDVDCWPDLFLSRRRR